MQRDRTEAEARMHFYADTIGVEPPARMIEDDETYSDGFLVFCRRYGASLDWIMLGDVRGMIHNSYKVARHGR